MIDRVAEARQRRISTGELNRWLASVDLERGTTPASRKVKIFYITQATAGPPTFVLFTNQTKPLHFSFQRFLENRLREKFDFLGTPIRFTQRLKKSASRDDSGREPRRLTKHKPRHSQTARMGTPRKTRPPLKAGTLSRSGQAIAWAPFENPRIACSSLTSTLIDLASRAPGRWCDPRLSTRSRDASPRKDVGDWQTCCPLRIVFADLPRLSDRPKSLPE